MSEIEKFIESNDITVQEILNNLLDGTENLDLKTQIFKPKQLSALVSIGEYLKNNECNESSKLIYNFIEKYLRYMVSFKRESRKEIIKAITNKIKNMKPQYMKKAFKLLVSNGFLVKHPARRSTTYGLTPKGLKAGNEIYKRKIGL